MRTADPRRLWLFPLAAILTALPWVVIFPLRHGFEGKQEQAVLLASASYRAAGYLYFAGFICLLLAIITLVAMAEVKRPSAWAVAALVLDVGAVVMICAVEAGVLSLAGPTVASYYLRGHQEVGALLVQLSGDSFDANTNTWLLVAIGVAVIGAVATGVCTWRAGIGRWSGVLLAAGFALVLDITPRVSWVGSALLLGAGAWMAWRTDSSEVAAVKRTGVASL